MNPTTHPPTIRRYRSIGEMFTALPTLTKVEDRVALLQANADQPLFFLLKLAFHPDCKWVIPAGAPPYKQDVGSVGLTPSTLAKELRIIYLFLDGGEPKITSRRREELFQNLMERLYKDEVDLLIAIKDKQFAKKFKCTKAIVEQAFPGLLDTTFTPFFKK